MDAVPDTPNAPFVVADAQGRPTGATDPHVGEIHDVVPSTAAGCEDCLREGTAWVHLRLCLSCGHVGCCDSSPRRHARGHWRRSSHPIVRSFEPGEDWAWCFADEVLLLPVE
jgi:CPA1 family monovalent cation:H+ antiporter